MSYTVGKAHAKKHNYRVFVRTIQTAETFTTDEQVLAIIGKGANAGLTEVDVTTDGDDEAAITTANRLYQLSTDGENGEVDLQTTAPAGNPENIIIIRLEDNESGGYSVDVIDEDGVSVTLEAIGSYVALVYRNSKWVWFCTYVDSSDPNAPKTAGSQVATFREIGVCAEKPALNGSEGEEMNSNWGDSITISEILEVSIRDMEVTQDNYAYLRSLLDYNNGEIDIAVCDTDNVGESAFAYQMVVKVLPEITGNDINYVNVTAQKETGNLDDYFSLHNE